MLYEFRIYYPKADRTNDLNDRFQHYLPQLFERHGIHCSGYWVGEKQEHSPARFMYLLSFTNHDERDRAWNSFRADPQWHHVRQQTNGHEEILNSYDLFFLRERAGMAPPDKTLPLDGRYEFIFQETYHGKESEIDRWLQEYVIPSLNAMGAQNISCFDVTTGSQLPKLLLMIRWQNGAGQERYAQDAALFQQAVGKNAQNLLKSTERIIGRYHNSGTH